MRGKRRDGGRGELLFTINNAFPRFLRPSVSPALLLLIADSERMLVRSHNAVVERRAHI
jgi:hypothetical protein